MDYQEKAVSLKNGRSCVIRRPEVSDAERLLRYQKESSGETPYLVVEPEDIDWTAEDQAARIERWNVSPNRLRHRCCIDITLYKRFCGMGIGTALLGELLSAARSAGYEQAELEVVSANAPAIALYEKLGFEAIGTMPRALKYRDRTYADFLLMVKRL